MPWRNYEDSKFFTSGAGWAIDAQAVLYPFQHIDYVIASITALRLLEEWKKDRSASINKLIRLCRIKENLEHGLYTEAVLDSPFDEKSVELASSVIKEYLE